MDRPQDTDSLEMSPTAALHDLAPLPALLIEPAVVAALREDLGTAGDRTTAAVVPVGMMAHATIAARAPGRIAGTACIAATFAALDPAVSVVLQRPDGSDVEAGEVIATLAGPARPLLTGERTALNFLGHLSGIATTTRDLVRAIHGERARICCTRKTTPGLRALEKYAVRAGGGVNHRFGLDDGILIKDNHIAIAGSVGEAVARARRAAGHMVTIEVEVDDLDQLAEALAAEVEAVLLDNMAPETLREAVVMAQDRVLLEASGGVTPETAPAIAATGVDLISVGWITHSAPSLDVGLDFVADSSPTS
jgi:nicotinate-nucleotide pyrophosphorylase (carboxylating)